MKSSLVVVSFVGIALIAGAILYPSWHKPSPAPVAVSDTTRVETIAPPAQNVSPVDDSSHDVLPDLEASVPSTFIEPVLVEATPVAATDPISQPSAFTRAIDTLVSPRASFEQKQAAFRALREAGQLDETIEALKQGATENPDSASYPAALGQAQLQKAGVISQSGGTISEIGILGMLADQNFDAALKLDPANWEAQFFKSAAMSHWPLELNKGDEVIQRLSRLIDQQKTMSPEPQFSQTYVLLGEQYQKMGKPEFAAATWQIGAQKFPSNTVLQQRIKGQSR